MLRTAIELPDFTRRQMLGVTAAFATALLVPRLLHAQEASEPKAPELVEMSLGQQDAPITMVEYASLTCPHCARFHAEVMPRLKENFIDTGKVRLIYREVFFDGPGLWGAMMARCAGPDRYFGVIDLLYKTQEDWSRKTDPAEINRALYTVGRQAGLSDAQMEACMTDTDFAEALVAEFQKNVAADGIDSTPTFLIDGEKVQNMPYEQFETRFNEKLQG